ncbi:MAG TPA: hypothetical protein DCZ76_07510 [Treponema sp.]|nr:hypothetical protein [Treponema sp.]
MNVTVNFIRQISSFILVTTKLAPSDFCPEKRLPRYACAEFFSVQKSLPPISQLQYVILNWNL